MCICWVCAKWVCGAIYGCFVIAGSGVKGEQGREAKGDVWVVGGRERFNC